MKRKLLWVVAVGLCAVAYIFENNAGTLTALACACLLPVFGMLPLLAPAKVSAKWEAPPAVEKGGTVCGKLILKNEAVLPVCGLELTVSCRNIRTGGEQVRRLDVGLPPKREKTLEFFLSCDHCGRLALSVQNAARRDWFGMTKKAMCLRGEAEVTVLPRLFSPDISLRAWDLAIPDSDTYSCAKSGGDPGETAAIREYVPGDAVRSIHWKLSEKTGRLMAREFGLPVVSEVLLMLETGGAACEAETDAVTEVFASVCRGLSDMGVAYHTVWTDGDENALCVQTVSVPEDVGELLSRLMELPPAQSVSVVRRFTEEMGPCGDAHVIVVGARMPEGIHGLCNGGRVSVLLLRQSGICEGLWQDGVSVRCFGTESYASDLTELEV